jgi:PAS domain S-box-containing protein
MNIRSLTEQVDWYAVVASMAGGMMVCTLDGRIMGSSETADLMDLAEGEGVGRTPAEIAEAILYPDGRHVPDERPIWHNAAPGEPFVRGILLRDGTVRWLRFDKHVIPIPSVPGADVEPQARRAEAERDAYDTVEADSGPSDSAPSDSGRSDASLSESRAVLLLISETQFPFPATPSAARPASVYHEDSGSHPLSGATMMPEEKTGDAGDKATENAPTDEAPTDASGQKKPKRLGISPVDTELDSVAAVGLFRSTPQHGIIAIDDGMENLLGYSAAELRMMDPGRLTYDPRTADRLLEKRRAEGGLFREHVHLRRCDGQAFWGLLNSIPRRDDRGDVLYYDSMLVDITDQKEAQLALEASEELYRVLAENSVDVITRHALDSTYHYISPASEAVLGYRPEEMMGRRAIELTHPEDLGIYRHIAQALDNGARIKERVRFRHKDGHYVWLEVTGRLIRDPSSDRGIEYIASSRDVTAQVESENVLRQAAQRLRILSDISQATLRTTDLETVCQVALDTLARAIPQSRSSIFSFDMDEEAATVLAIYADESREEVQVGTSIPLAWLHTVRALRDGEHVEMQDLKATDASSPLLSRLAKMGIRSFISVPAVVEGQTVGALNVGHDEPHAFSRDDIEITSEVARLIALAMRQKQVQDDLVEAKEEAEEMSRLKSAFLANMSHEIRTPLTAILGFADVLDAEAAPPHDGIARLISRSGQRLMETLDSVLQLSRLEAGNLQLSPEPIDVISEVQEVVTLMKARAEAEGIHLVLEIPDAPVEGRYDAMALYRVLTNLVSNAIKFTAREGQVTVRVQNVEQGEEPEPMAEPHPLEPGTPVVRIDVEDTGIGMNPSVIPELFGAFRQESTGTRRSHEGSGLGLTIVRRLVDLMHGHIEVESEKGKGSSFRVYLPQDASDHHFGSGSDVADAPPSF